MRYIYIYIYTWVLISPQPDQEGKNLGSISETRAISTRRELPSSFFFLQDKAPNKIHAILTETLACFLPGRAKDLSAPLYTHTHTHIYIYIYICIYIHKSMWGKGGKVYIHIYPLFLHMLLYYTQDLSFIAYKFIRQSHGSGNQQLVFHHRDLTSISHLFLTVDEVALGQVFLRILTDILQDRDVFIFRVMQL